MIIGDCLNPVTVNLQLRSATRDDALRELVQMIPELQGRAAEQLSMWQALHDREKLHSTAVGEGLAFPHARNPMGNFLKRCIVVIGRHAQGIAWEALDDKPVRLIFLLAAPSLPEHLHLLGQMSRILRDAKTREALLNANEAARVLDVLKAAESRLAR